MQSNIIIILLFVLSLITLVTILELSLYYFTKHKTKKILKLIKSVQVQNGIHIPEEIKFLPKPMLFDYNEEKKCMRRPVGLEYKDKPILIFGCSCPYGYGLEDEETFSYKLSHLSNRPVYNYAYNGWGVQHMYYLLNNNELYNEIKEPEYIVYFMMTDFLHRLFRYQFLPPSIYIPLRYKKTKKGFKEIKPLLSRLWTSYIVKYIQCNFLNKLIYTKMNMNKLYEYFYEMMEECILIAKSHYPDTKFIILLNRRSKKQYDNLDEMTEKLTQMGYTIIDTNELTDVDDNVNSDFYISDKSHFSGKVWDIVVPKFIEKLKI